MPYSVLVWGRLGRGESDDADRLEPIYLHGPAGGDSPDEVARPAQAAGIG